MLLDVMDCVDFRRDTLWLAERFPSLPVICLHAMWPQHIALFDLVRRCPSVSADTSWIQTAGTLAQMRDAFGEERMVFGLGPKAHQGAAIGALLRSELEPDEQELVAHRNLERHLGLGPSGARLAGSGAAKASVPWPRFLPDEPLGAEIVDAHAHLGLAGYWLVEHDEALQMRYHLRRMERLGIGLSIVSGGEALSGNPVSGNRYLSSAAAGAGSLRGYLGFNPVYHESLAPELDRLFADPFFVGFKTLCDYWYLPVTDRRFRPMLEYANAHRLPILYHTWDGPYDSPAMLTEIVRRYPEAIFLLGHSGGGDAGREEAVELCPGNPNVYLEWCGSFCSRSPWEQTLSRVGAGRVVFGTDACAHDMAW
jgi:hypothetical protein